MSTKIDAVSRLQSVDLASLWQRLIAARWLWLPLLAFTVTRVGIALVAYVAVVLLPESTPPPYHLRPPDNVLLDVFGSRWDTGFYVSIAERGYVYEGADLPSVAFFPLLPLVMRAVAALVGDAVVAGVIVSNVALLLAAILLYRLVAMEGHEGTPGRAVWYLLIFPTAFFGSAIYTESLFLLCAIGALYFARRNFWESAALLGVGAALTRLVGVLVAPLLLLEWWMQRRREGGPRPGTAALLAPLAVPLGTLGYMAFLQRKFGDPLAFVRAAAAWERTPQSPLLTVTELFRRPAGGWGQAILSGQIHVNDWIDFGFVVLFLILGLALLARRRWSEGVFVLLGTLIAFSSGLLMSQRRYMWILFPAFILLARWGHRPWVDRIVTLFSLLGLALFTALFANGYWVG